MGIFDEQDSHSRYLSYNTFLLPTFLKNCIEIFIANKIDCQGCRNHSNPLSLTKFLQITWDRNYDSNFFHIESNATIYYVYLSRTRDAFIRETDRNRVVG